MHNNSTGRIGPTHPGASATPWRGANMPFKSWNVHFDATPRWCAVDRGGGTAESICSRSLRPPISANLNHLPPVPRWISKARVNRTVAVQRLLHEFHTLGAHPIVGLS